MATNRKKSPTCETMLESILAGVVVLDAQARVLSVNRAAEKLTGINGRLLIGKSLDKGLGKFLRSDGSELSLKEFLVDRVLREKAPVRDSIIGLPGAGGDGKTVWMLASAVPVTGETGAIETIVLTFVDSTMRKVIEEELISSRERCRCFSEAAFEGIMVHEKGVILDVNTAFVSLFGYKDATELIGKYGLQTLIAERSRPAIMEVMKETEYTPIEIVCIRKDGSEFIAETRGRQFSFAGKPVRVVSIRDITVKKSDEVRLRKAEAEWQQTFDGTHDAICLLDPDQKIVRCNRAMIELFGKTADEINGKFCYQVVHGTTMPVEGCPVGRMKQSLRRETMELRVKGRWFEVSADPLLGEDGTLSGVVHIVRDITERIRSREELAQSEEKYRALAESSPEMIYLIDRDGVVRYINTAAAKMFHAKVDSVIGKHLRDLYPAPVAQRHMNAINSVIKTGKPLTTEMLEPFPGGMCWIDARLSPVRDGSGAITGVLGLSQDITERKRMEQELKKSIELYHDLVETAQDLIWQCDGEARYTYLNPAWESVLGYRLDEMLGKKFADFQQEDRASLDSREFLRLLRDGMTMGYETVHLSKDGRSIHLVFNAKYIKDADGTIIGTRGTAYDITERKKMEMELRKSEERLSSLFSNMAEGVALHEIVFDNAGTPVNYRIIDCNLQYEKIIGIKRENVLGKLATEVYQMPEPPYLAEFATPGMTGVPAHIEVYFAPMDIYFDISIAPWGKNGFATIFTDISQRKKSEAAILAEKERAQRYLDIAGVMFVALDTQGTVTLINQKGCAILECGEGGIVGKNWFESFVPQSARDEVKKVFDKMMAGTIDLVEYFENTVVTGKGEERAIAWHNSILRDNQGKILGTLSSGEDITDRRKMEEELLRKQKMDALGVLAGGIAHDFNNLLAGVFGFMDLARESMRPGDPAVGYLGKAFIAFDRAKSLSRQLLTFSKGGAPVKQPVRVADMLRECSNLSLSGSNVRCVFSLQDSLAMVDADVHQLSQVFSNIMINARQAMPEGGCLTISGENRTLSGTEGIPLPQGTYAMIAIRDEGIGIPEKIMAKIFDPFFTTKQQGSGLGLAICYSIVKKHGGHISVDSAQGAGATFAVWLPVSGKAAAPNGKNHDALSLKGSGNVLVMDDEPSIREMATHMLSSFGYSVVTAANGKEAIEKYRSAMTSNKPFDIVILDLTVPGGMGGEKAIVELKKIDPNVIACVTSGYADNAILSDPAAYGFSAMIAKPYRSTDLLKTVKEALGKRKG
jgi:two-component system, cell cycle sensor histidine kinase and response regulator CckA